MPTMPERSLRSITLTIEHGDGKREAWRLTGPDLRISFDYPLPRSSTFSVLGTNQMAVESLSAPPEISVENIDAAECEHLDALNVTNFQDFANGYTHWHCPACGAWWKRTPAFQGRPADTTWVRTTEPRPTRDDCDHPDDMHHEITRIGDKERRYECMACSVRWTEPR